MNTYSFIPPALTSLTIAVFLFASIRKWHVPLYRSLAILCINTIWWHGSWVFLFLAKSESSARMIAKVGHVGILGLPLTFHYFYARLVGKPANLAVTKISLYVLFLICLIFTPWIISGVNHFDWGYYPKAGILHPVFLLMVTYFLCNGLWLCYCATRDLNDEANTKILKLCQFAGVIYSLAGVDFLVNYRFTEVYPFGFSFSLIFLAVLGYAISNSDLFSVEERLKQVHERLAESNKKNKLLEEAIKERDYLKGNLENEVTRKTKELQEALQNLKSAQLKILHNSQMAQIGELSASVAHEINTPLRGASWAAGSMEDLLKSGTLGEKETEYLKEDLARIRASIDYINSIITNIMSAAGNPHLPCQMENISEIIRVAIGVTGYNFQGKAIINVEVDPDLRGFLQRVKAIRCIINLITNAVDAMQEAQTQNARVDIKACTQNDRLLFKISDNGPGIPAAIQEKIFQPFNTSKPAGKGIGLGLSMVKHMVEEMGGTIEFTTSSTGTEMTLIFETRKT